MKKSIEIEPKQRPVGILEGVVEDIEVQNQAFNILTNKDKIELTTELKNPLAITSLDLLSKITKNPSLEYFLTRYRTNYIPFNRKRAQEILDANRAEIVAKQEKENSFIDRLLGK